MGIFSRLDAPWEHLVWGVVTQPATDAVVVSDGCKYSECKCKHSTNTLDSKWVEPSISIFFLKRQFQVDLYLKIGSNTSWVLIELSNCGQVKSNFGWSTFLMNFQALSNILNLKNVWYLLSNILTLQSEPWVKNLTLTCQYPLNLHPSLANASRVDPVVPSRWPSSSFSRRRSALARLQEHAIGIPCCSTGAGQPARLFCDWWRVVRSVHRGWCAPYCTQPANR